MNITRGKQVYAKKCCVYGPEGIGKSTFASQFPEPLYIDTEGSTKELNVARFDAPDSWTMLLQEVQYVIDNPGCCKSLVIDTADWAERLAITEVCKKNKWQSLETPGYGRGYTYLGDEFSRLLASLDKVIAVGINVVITAHAKMRKFELPDEMGAYDRWEMKLSKQVAPPLKEWCDILLFLNYQTFVVTTENKSQKAQGGKRVMYTSHHPCWDAKNRHGLPDVLDLDYGNIAELFEQNAAPTLTPTITPLDTLKMQLAAANITEASLLQFVTAKGYQKDAASLGDYPDCFITGWVLKYWNQIVTAVTATATNNNNNGGTENE